MLSVWLKVGLWLELSLRLVLGLGIVRIKVSVKIMFRALASIQDKIGAIVRFS